MHPRSADIFDGAAHPDGVNLRRRRQRANDHRDVVTAALLIGDIREKKSAAIFFRNAAEKLPAHQGMQFRVFVDGTINAQKQSGGFKLVEMRLKIEAGAAGGCVMRVVFRGDAAH